MFGKDQFGAVFTVIFAFFFSLALTAFTLYGQGRLTLGTLIPAFLSSLPGTFVFAYVIAVLCSPLLEKLTKSLCVK